VFRNEDFNNYDSELLGARLRGAAAQVSRMLADLPRGPAALPGPAQRTRKNAAPASRSAAAKRVSTGRNAAPTQARKSAVAKARRSGA
jgi:hypothetical protein